MGARNGDDIKGTIKTAEKAPPTQTLSCCVSVSEQKRNTAAKKKKEPQSGGEN